MCAWCNTSHLEVDKIVRGGRERGRGSVKRRGREGRVRLERRERGEGKEGEGRLRRRERERERKRDTVCTCKNYVTHQVHYEDHVTHKPSAQSGGLLVYILKTDAILLFSPAPPSLSLPPLAIAP